MANSRFEYVRGFEQEDVLLPNTWIVVRIDGRGFHQFSHKNGFEKPNDRRAMNLMNAAAVRVMTEIPDLILGYGVSDEFRIARPSFVFHKDCCLFDRRKSKITTTIVSTFTACYVHEWPNYFSNSPLTPPLPTFDGRAVCYPSTANLRDYMSWRQVDCHINNLYNTTFWALIQKGGISAPDAEKQLQGTVSSDKHEILFSQFGVNYNNEPDIFKKGSVLFRDFALETGDPLANDVPAALQISSENGGAPSSVSKTAAQKERKRAAKAGIVVEHIDIIKDEFWYRRPWLLTGAAGTPRIS